MASQVGHVLRSAILALVILPTVASALDHDNLDPNRPIAIEDAYVIPKGEIGLEGGMTFNDRKQGKSRFGFQPQIIYGAFDNTQIEIMSGLVTEPNTVRGAAKDVTTRQGSVFQVDGHEGRLHRTAVCRKRRI